MRTREAWAPAFSPSDKVCHGEICLWCDQRILGLGVHLTVTTLLGVHHVQRRLTVITHAHRACAPEALTVLACR